ncbi:MAG: 50S ribosomal protein L10 [Bacteroidia bacterium]|nr:50S ribosomal protein L10 [Bacteroidia bacterium]
MNKEQKIQLVEELAQKFRDFPTFYLTDTGGLTVAEVYELRKLCYESGLEMTMVKNTLIEKALEQVEGDFSEVYGILKRPTSIFFTHTEKASEPAKVIQKFRKTSDKPILKAAVIETAVYLGDDQLKALTELKSKDQLIGEIVGLLQSPAKNVISALKSGGNTIAGLVKTLSERQEA